MVEKVTALVVESSEGEGRADRIKQEREIDERHAWDRYAASFSAMVDPHIEATVTSVAFDASVYADAMLEERRKRWGR